MSQDANRSSFTSAVIANNLCVATSNAPLSLACDTTMQSAKVLRHQLGNRVSEVVVGKLANRIAIYKAAAAIHRSPAYINSMINEGLIKAYRIGGSVNKPWLVVDLSELLAVMDRETLYVPPAQIGRRAPRPRINRAALHPFAASL